MLFPENRHLTTQPLFVPFLRVKFDWHILMTRRAAHLAHHAGQISFPGGKIEPHDASPVEAALREAREEVQLNPGLVRVVGLLDRVPKPGRISSSARCWYHSGEDALGSPGSTQQKWIDFHATANASC